jgi:hypothetical protein
MTGGQTARPDGRLLVRRLGKEAVVLDVATGSFFRVEGAGVGIAEALARGEAPGAVAERLARETGIELGRARADIDDVVVALAGAGPPATRDEPAFAPAWNGLELRWDGRAVLRVDGSGRRASLLGDAAAPPSPGERLRWALPHLVWIAGGVVLHAAAARLGGAVLALTGASGSGKTTLARLLACGVEPVSDDLLFLRPGPAGLEAVLGGEAAVRAWEAREVPRLAGGQEARLEGEDLAAFTAGPALPLSGIWLLDATRREADEISLAAAAGAEGLALLLHQSFGETGAPEVWRRILDVSAGLVEAVPIFRASVPGTLSQLDDAARRYRANVAS